APKERMGATPPPGICRRERDIGTQDGLFCRRSVKASESGGDQFVGSRSVAYAPDVLREAFVRGQSRLAQELGAEFRPLPIALNRDQHLFAVARGEDAVGRDR